MTTEGIMSSINNAWCGLCRQYANTPHDETRVALNLLSKIIGKIETEITEDEAKKEGQISIEEWMAWFKEAEQ